MFLLFLCGHNEQSMVENAIWGDCVLSSSFPWRTGEPGNLLYGLKSHRLDQAWHFFGYRFLIKTNKQTKHPGSFWCICVWSNLRLLTTTSKFSLEPIQKSANSSFPLARGSVTVYSTTFSWIVSTVRQLKKKKCLLSYITYNPVSVPLVEQKIMEGACNKTEK